MRTMKRVLLSVGATSLAWLAVGCGPGPFNVEVFLDESDTGLRDKVKAIQSLEVNLVGVNATEVNRWKQMSMNGYWEPDSPIRKSAKKYVMTFGQAHPKTQVLKKHDPVWSEWITKLKANHLFILVYLPWIHKDQPGDADPRRIALPLEKGRWEWSLWGADTIKIQIGSGGITCLRQPKPDE